MIIYFWPTVLAMLVCRALQRFTGIEPTSLGWRGSAFWRST